MMRKPDAPIRFLFLVRRSPRNASVATCIAGRPGLLQSADVQYARRRLQADFANKKKKRGVSQGSRFALVHTIWTTLKHHINMLDRGQTPGKNISQLARMISTHS